MILKNFIVFEGIDGSGTSTQLTKLSEAFNKDKNKTQEEVFFTFEPTNNPIGMLLRKALSENNYFSSKTLAYLFATDRAEHLYGQNGIIEHINAGKIVISDRYVFSSLAYQGESCSYELTKQLNSHFPLPEHLFYFDIDPNLALARIESRNRKKEIFEIKDFLELVRSRYEKVLDEYKKEEPKMNIYKIDGTKSILEISDYIWSIVKNLPK